MLQVEFEQPNGLPVMPHYYLLTIVKAPADSAALNPPGEAFGPMLGTLLYQISPNCPFSKSQLSISQALLKTDCYVA